MAASSKPIITSVDLKFEHTGRMRNTDLGSMMNKYGISREDISEFMLSAPDSSGVNDPPHGPIPELSDYGGSIIHTPIFIHPDQDLGFFPIIPPRGLRGLAASP